MRLAHGIHLAYCTNVAPAETWEETFAFLRGPMQEARKLAGLGEEHFALGLRLSDRASRELAGNRAVLREFRRWLESEDAYVFTINGFPFGAFHGGPVKERVYAPDWTTPERLAYTNRLFDLLAELVPDGVSGSVSTLPVSFKEFGADEVTARANLWRCIEHAADLSVRTGKELHLGIEPEPLGHVETSEEAVSFFERMREDRPNDGRVDLHLGVTYDACHMAIQFEEARDALLRLLGAGIRISKLHLSSALSLRPDAQSRKGLGAFAEEVYLHQVIARDADGALVRFRDLPDALGAEVNGEEWRVHFHIPLHAPAGGWFRPTTGHLLDLLDLLAAEPGWCDHLEMETYTWAVLPEGLRARGVAEQIAAEYGWCLAELAERGLTAPRE